ncbi:transketolase [Ramicandelaber brevisporus]|nr:transketolase [Ramicandelaber brevisporus]
MTAAPAIDDLCINTVRTLAADTVQGANSGHPGAPMGCAPMAHLLFSKYINCDPSDYKWPARDRFVLSNGHACALQYVMLHLLGYDSVKVEDLKQFRQWGSTTPGHPENTHTHGIEVATGPLGQGISNAVGLAMGEAHLAAVFNKPGYENLVNNYTYVILGDGCLQEGVSAEAASLAGHLKLGKLICLYDDNNITIDGETEISFTENVEERFRSYGWHTTHVDDGNSDLAGLISAIEESKAVTDKPSLIRVKTVIGYGSAKQGTEGVHGAPLGAADIVNVKTKFGFNPEDYYFVPAAVRSFYADVRARGQQKHAEWNKLFAAYEQEYPELAAEFKRRVIEGKLPANWADKLPKYTPEDKPVATRKLSENVLNAIAENIPELIGGSADLTGSNLTRWKSAVDFQHPSTKLGDYAGRYIRFGVREHGMSAICNGLDAYGGIIPFGSTFLNFITYAWGAVRLSALAERGVIYIMTHDSIGLGEDGPTHQPIETLALLRATPNMLTLRPADGNEVSGAYIAALEHRRTPSVLALTRQNLPHLAGSSAEKVLLGGYTLVDAGTPDVVLVGTGSEVHLCVDAAAKLAASGVKANVVSMPCTELFDKQSFEYRRSVFPTGVPVLSVECMSTETWHKYSHAQIGLDRFGASAPAPRIFKEFGFTAENIAAKADGLVKFYKQSGRAVGDLVDRFH